MRSLCRLAPGASAVIVVAANERVVGGTLRVAARDQWCDDGVVWVEAVCVIALEPCMLA